MTLTDTSLQIALPINLQARLVNQIYGKLLDIFISIDTCSTCIIVLTAYVALTKNYGSPGSFFPILEDPYIFHGHIDSVKQYGC